MSGAHRNFRRSFAGTTFQTSQRTTTGYQSRERAARERFAAASPRAGAPLAANEAALGRRAVRDRTGVWFCDLGETEASHRGLEGGTLAVLASLAEHLAAAYSSGDAEAIREVNRNYGSSFTWDHDAEKMQRRLPSWFVAETRTAALALADAKQMVAHVFGFGNWQEFAASVNQAPGDPRSAPVYLSSTPPFYRIDWRDNRIEVRGPQTEKDWDTVFHLMKEHGISKLSAGSMSNAAMKRLTRLDQVTHLQVGGWKALTDEGAAHLEAMPQLIDLELGGWSSPITDAGLSGLRKLTRLRQFKACWSQGISDAGLANLAFCEELEGVNLMGTPAGDGTIQALTGKRRLRHFKTGRGVTDAGLALLHRFPVFKTWQGGEVKYGMMSFESEPNHLLIDGGFTDAGLASLAGLDGLFGLGFFWHCKNFTSAGLEPLKDLRNLGFLGCQDEHCDDEAMRHIAAIPRLRMLMGQGAVAGDEGWTALSRSQTIEYIWGRECPNLMGRGFLALAGMPALRGIAVSCKQVDDAALAVLPRFPALRDLVPMDVNDSGFRHVGACEGLERLWCMYCQETGDAATEQIASARALEVVLCRKDEDHGPEPGDSGRDGVAGAGGILAMFGNHRRGSRAAGRAAEAAGGDLGWNARGNPGRARHVSGGGAGELHRLGIAGGDPTSACARMALLTLATMCNCGSTTSAIS